MRSDWRRRWDRYGPGLLRWRKFRLYGDPPNGKWMPMRVKQIIGGQSWSLAITRTGPAEGTAIRPYATGGPVRHAAATALDPDECLLRPADVRAGSPRCLRAEHDGRDCGKDPDDTP